MYCYMCAAEVPPGARFCPHCAAEQPEMVRQARPQDTPQPIATAQPQAAPQPVIALAPPKSPVREGNRLLGRILIAYGVCLLVWHLHSYALMGDLDAWPTAMFSISMSLYLIAGILLLNGKRGGFVCLVGAGAALIGTVLHIRVNDIAPYLFTSLSAATSMLRQLPELFVGLIAGFWLRRQERAASTQNTRQPSGGDRNDLP